MRGAWIEILSGKSKVPYILSLPVRGAWIEIRVQRDLLRSSNVAPCEGSVD